jgi:hypothetical protein
MSFYLGIVAASIVVLIFLFWLYLTFKVQGQTFGERCSKSGKIVRDILCCPCIMTMYWYHERQIKNKNANNQLASMQQNNQIRNDFNQRNNQHTINPTQNNNSNLL